MEPRTIDGTVYTSEDLDRMVADCAERIIAAADRQVRAEDSMKATVSKCKALADKMGVDFYDAIAAALAQACIKIYEIKK